MMRQLQKNENSGKLQYQF